MRLHYRNYGQGPPLIVLHGLFGSLENWHSFATKLGSEFQVFAVDQRNHGESPHAAEMSYPLMASDLKEFVETLQLGPIYVLGHSMGGKTAMQFALLYPDLVKRLVVADIAPRAYPRLHQSILSALLSLDLSASRDRRYFEQALAPEIPSLATRQFLLKNLKRHPDGSFYWRLGLQEIQQNYRELGRAVDGTNPFNGPALFLRGERSDYLTEEDQPAIQQLFPAAQFQTIPGAGHLLHVENATEFIAAICKFVHPQFAR